MKNTIDNTLTKEQIIALKKGVVYFEWKVETERLTIQEGLNKIYTLIPYNRRELNRIHSLTPSSIDGLKVCNQGAAIYKGIFCSLYFPYAGFVDGSISLGEKGKFEYYAVLVTLEQLLNFNPDLYTDEGDIISDTNNDTFLSFETLDINIDDYIEYEDVQCLPVINTSEDVYTDYDGATMTKEEYNLMFSEPFLPEDFTDREIDQLVSDSYYDNEWQIIADEQNNSTDNTNMKHYHTLVYTTDKGMVFSNTIESDSKDLLITNELLSAIASEGEKGILTSYIYNGYMTEYDFYN